MKNTSFGLYNKVSFCAAFLIAGASLLNAQAVIQPDARPADSDARKSVGTKPSTESQASAAGHEDEDENSGDIVVLAEFTVTGKDDGSYLATESTSGTRIASQIINMPYNIQVLTQDFIQDFQLYDVDLQAPFISGMTPGDPATGGGGATKLRGFNVPYFRNGFFRTQAPDSSSIERTETVKGPQSAVYGRSAPGGVVNFIAKRPASRFKTGVGGTLGSYSYQRYDAYVTGPIVRNKLFYRVDLSHYHFKRNTDFWFNRTTNISGALTYKFNTNTSLTFEIEHTDRMMNDFAATVRYIDRHTFTDSSGASIPVISGSVYDIADREKGRRIARFNSNGEQRRTSRRNDSYYLQMEHRIMPDLSMRLNTTYTTRSFWRHWAGTLVLWDPDNNRWSTQGGTAQAFRISMNHQTIDYEEYGSQLDFTKVWRTDTSLRQRTLVTFDFFRNTMDQKTWELIGDNLENALKNEVGLTEAEWQGWRAADPLNTEPKYSLYPSFNAPGWVYAQASTGYGNTFYTDLRFYGALLNHTIDMFDGKLNITGSIRQDYSEIVRRQPLNANVYLKNATGNVRAFTYSAGVTYNILGKKLVAYFSNGKSFNPTPTVDPNVGTIYGNLRGEGTDLGLKGLLFRERFSYTVSFYRIKQTNETTRNPLSQQNPEDTSIPYYMDGGVTEGQGAAIDVSGRLLPGLAIIGNMSWVSIETVENKGNPALVGTRPIGIPVRMGAIALRYSPQNFLRGLTLSARYTYNPPYLNMVRTDSSAYSLERLGYYAPGVSEWTFSASLRLKLRNKNTVDFQVMLMNAFDDDRLTPLSFAPNGREFRMSLKYSY